MTGKMLITIICFLYVLILSIFAFKTKNKKSMFIPFNNHHEVGAINIPISIIFMISFIEIIYMFLEFISNNWDKPIF
jgi:uncharacterized membrane protein YhdT